MLLALWLLAFWPSGSLAIGFFLAFDVLALGFLLLVSCFYGASFSDLFLVKRDLPFSFHLPLVLVCPFVPFCSSSLPPPSFLLPPSSLLLPPLSSSLVVNSVARNLL